MKNWLSNFMLGRNGMDQLVIAQVALALVLQLLSGVLDTGILSLFSNAMLVWAAFRMLSRNLSARSVENQRFLLRLQGFRTDTRAWRERLRHRKEYKFFHCPGCGNWLRVPRGKGKIQITCPRCGHRFSGRT